MDEALEDEFDVVPSFVVEAVSALGPSSAIPAACRGSASPLELAWLAEACSLTPGSRPVDVGAGIGGPSAWASRRFGVTPVLVDPMPGACRAAASLFGLPAVVGDGHAVPLASSSFDVAWCLGVLCTTTRKPALVAELRRLLRPGGSLGLLAFTADTPRPPGAPDGNVFPSAAEVADLLESSGFTVRESVPTSSFPPSPLSWTTREEAVTRFISDRHGSDPHWRTASDQSARMGHLLKTEEVRGLLLHAEAT